MLDTDKNPHKCRFISRFIADDWTHEGLLKERGWTLHFICAECGKERPSRKPRAFSKLEQEAELSSHLFTPNQDPNGRIIANVLVRSCLSEKLSISARGLFGKARKSGVPVTISEQWIERFLQAGWVRLFWKLSGTTRNLEKIEIINNTAKEALREYASPGNKEAKRKAIEHAIDVTKSLTHPVAQDVRNRLVSTDIESYDIVLINGLAAIALHIETGDILAERVFAAKYLGDSKALKKLRPRIERIIGPLDALGIREGAVLTLMGGKGRLFIGGTIIDLSVFQPYLGISREMVGKINHIEFPIGGLFIVENLTVFEACCRGEVKEAQDCFILWSAGYPGRSVHSIVEHCARAGLRTHIWADLDLDGIRITRLIASWNPKYIEPYRMSTKEINLAKSRISLTERGKDAIERDLNEHPTLLLSETLKAILIAGHWVEQESQLGKSE